MHFFGPATQQWFSNAFAAPTEVQRLGWARIHAGEHALLIAPTGSGKTLAAFLYALDRLAYAAPTDDESASGARVVYVSPLKALVYDIERNLRAPLAGIARAAAGSSPALQLPTVDVRTGDTTSQERRRQLREPAEILVTTPESLFLLLGSQARENLRTVRWIIVDEIHAMAATKRGAHLALSLERLAALCDADPQRIGLSATARPAEEIARFLGGDRPVSIVDAHVPPDLDLQVIVPVDDMTRPVVETEDGGYATLAADRPSGSLMLAEEAETNRQYGIWPAVYPRLLDLVRTHRTTLIFVNSRGLCERLAQRLNEQAGEELVRAHHGSLAQEQRRTIEEQLKSGELRALVATSSLELGIDMGAVDLVILVESPGSVARGLQRVGRAGHQVGETSIGRIFPKHRGDLLEAAIVAQRMRMGAIEALRIPKNPLDVLAQHVVAMAGVQDWPVPELAALVRRAANFRELPDTALNAVLDMLAGLYPSHEFAELRPRILWDRERDVISGRAGARMLAAVNAGTIPDRGLFTVYLGADGPRVGELDEEMVHESQAGQTLTLGATTWRIQEITRDRVIVEPAPGETGKLPFWHGEGPGRPLELGRALGEFTRKIAQLEETAAGTRLQADYGLDLRAANNLVRYLADQREATGVLPSDRDIVIERFRDELGDWRVCVLTPFGARVHAPWALVLRSIASERVGYEVQAVWSDDGIVITLADGDDPPDIASLVPDPEEIEERIITELARSPLFASQFRENAARALLLPRRRPGQRTPLFAQRLRAQKLMSIALQFPAFPIVMETYRACLQDVFDVPALRDVLRAAAAGEVRIHDVETAAASPFARSLVFAYVAAYLYEGDSPAAERRAQTLSLDLSLLRELLGEADLREFLDAHLVDEVEDQLQRRTPLRRARNADELHDVLRQLGDLSLDELRERSDGDPADRLEVLRTSRRAFPARVAGREVWLAVEDVALYRDALGTAPPQGVPAAYLATEEKPVEMMLLRWARTHGPFTAASVAARFGMVPAQVRLLLQASAQEQRLLRGEFRPGTQGEEWCDPEVLRQIKRRTIAKLRGQVSPVPREVLGRFLPSWHRVGTSDRHERLIDAIAQLEGLPLSYQELVRMILPMRVRGFRAEQLDELGAMGQLVWVGHSPLGSDDGRIMLFRRDRVDRLLIPTPVDEVGAEFDDRHHRLLSHLEYRGASFHGELLTLLPEFGPERTQDAIWDLVWAGQLTNDTFAPLRSLAARHHSRPAQSARRRPFPQHGAVGAAARNPSAGFAGGRWSLVRDLVHNQATSTERAHAWGATLLERHGIVAKETAAIEALGGGFSNVYRVLRSMEEAGKLRRGYFVEGLGGAQFAYPGTVDRLRRVRDEDAEAEVVALAAADPANPYGWLLPWPPLSGPGGASAADEEAPARGTAGPRRATGAAVVLVGGVPVLYLDRNARRLRTFSDVDDEQLERALPVLRDIARYRSRGAINLERINNESAMSSALLPQLERAGFRPDYRYLRITADA
jgi:ATP-dependent helicase Lhr and Lhr-like helicase